MGLETHLLHIKSISVFQTFQIHESGNSFRHRIHRKISFHLNHESRNSFSILWFIRKLHFELIMSLGTHLVVRSHQQNPNSVNYESQNSFKLLLSWHYKAIVLDL